jgi:hypothetical protein
MWSAAPLVGILVLGIGACVERDPPRTPLAPLVWATSTAQPPTAPSKFEGLDRNRFNQLAVRANLPLYWAADTNNDQSVDANEVRSLLFYPTEGHWTENGKLTPAFEQAFATLVALGKGEGSPATPAERARIALVVDDLDQGKPTLVESNLTTLPAQEKAAVLHILAATRLVDRLYARQTGSANLANQVAPDTTSQSLFRRNWGAKCLGPRTEKNSVCTAIPGSPKQKADVYPSALQDDAKFCQALEARKDAKQLLAPFVVVREKDKALIAVPYSEAYSDLMGPIAAELDAAVQSLAGTEAALASYLTAAASAFRNNGWEAADEAWSKMNAENSRYYLRIGPDETYWDPCSQKGGFHTTFALINKESLEWQKKLTPLQQEMEDSVAQLIGNFYKPQKVKFKLPDFIDIVWNAGDDRTAFGATIGQSLPNWGKVANENRGRTVAMSNLYTDADSLRTRNDQAASLLVPETAKVLSGGDARPGLLSTILHEATHNLGPSHEYAFAGKTDNIAFGGQLASMLEELKAQSGALYYLDFLANKGVIDDNMKRQSYADSVVWSFGHISRGMWTDNHQRKPYSQLAAIQIGFLMDEGAVKWDDKAKAANGKDTGAFRIDFDAMPVACEKLMQTVARIKARNDKAGAEALAKKYVDGNQNLQAAIVERMLRFPKNSFVYSVQL